MRRLLAIVLTLLLAACSRGPSPLPARKAIANATQAPQPSASPAAVIIHDPAGATVASIIGTNGTTDIEWSAALGQQRVHGTRTSDVKWKYNVPGGAVVLESRSEPGRGEFKVRLPDGTLRWKVKIGTGKIKISDNAENMHPYEIDPARVVAPDGTTLGRVMGNEVRDASGRTRFKITGPACACYAVLLLDRIPDRERYVLLSRLLAGQ